MEACKAAHTFEAARNKWEYGYISTNM